MKRLIFLAFLIPLVSFIHTEPKVEKKVVTNVNVIEIIMDDIGYEVPTYTGGQSYSTPNLDAYAAANLQFTQAHVSPTCTPSRMMLYSGKYNFRNYTVNRIMDDGVLTVANLCKLGGYATAIYGKWQLDGGDKIRSLHGFDRYSVLYPIGFVEDGLRYKNPKLYHPTGASTADYYYPTGYADDIFTDSCKSFMADCVGTSTPFYLQYSMSLPHTPWSPTPDDAEYAAWDEVNNKQDVRFFPSMVTYMDKKIKEVIDYVTTLGIQNNTVIIIIGDNGTSGGVTSQWNGQTIVGGKKTTINWATHVPMIVKWATHVTSAVDTNLISATDFLPTISDITGIPIPGGWGTIDGRSFYGLLSGGSYTPSPYWYLYWGNIDTKTQVWSMRFSPSVPHNLIKKYSGGFLYNTTTDQYEYCPITDATNDSYLNGIIQGLHK